MIHGANERPAAGWALKILWLLSVGVGLALLLAGLVMIAFSEAVGGTPPRFIAAFLIGALLLAAAIPTARRLFPDRWPR